MIIIAFIIIIFIIILMIPDSDMIKINTICILSINRGILSPNKFWWNVTDWALHDKSGVELFYNIKKKYNCFYKTNLLNTPIVLVMNINIINEILENSPISFAAGSLKYRFFKSFMIDNVGIATGKKWQCLRNINEEVLNTGRSHIYINKFNNVIDNLLNKDIPTNFDNFNIHAKHITSIIVFGINCSTTLPQKHVYNVINEANKLPILTNSKVSSYNNSQNYINNMLDNPVEQTLISMLSTYKPSITEHYGSNTLADQVYHFVFPIAALITVHVPRILALIFAHSEIRNKIYENLHNIEETKLYIHKCILETLRLNSPVISFFRKSTQPFLGFPINTEFLILTNPILRDPTVFTNPDIFIPDRWITSLIKSKYNLIFGLGPQQCPGKDLSINILQYYLYRYIICTKNMSLYLKNENIIYIDKLKPRISYYINPYKIIFVQN